MPYKPDRLAHFRTLTAMRAPRVASAVAWMLVLGIAIAAAIMALVPWVQTANGTGQVVALDPGDRQQQVTALVPGKVERWYVQDGQHVARGDPIARVVDLDPDLAPGRWTDGRRPLLHVVAPDRFDVQAYLPEDQGWRMAPGAEGRFVASGLSTAAAAVRLDEVGAGAVDTLAQPILAATHGGPIATTDRTLRPAHALVALRLIAERQDGQGFVQPVAGRVVLPARGDSPAAGIARAIGRVFAREMAF